MPLVAVFVYFSRTLSDLSHSKLLGLFVDELEDVASVGLKVKHWEIENNSQCIRHTRKRQLDDVGEERHYTGGGVFRLVPGQIEMERLFHRQRQAL